MRIYIVKAYTKERETCLTDDQNVKIKYPSPVPTPTFRLCRLAAGQSPSVPVYSAEAYPAGTNVCWEQNEFPNMVPEPGSERMPFWIVDKVAVVSQEDYRKIQEQLRQTWAIFDEKWGAIDKEYRQECERVETKRNKELKSIGKRPDLEDLLVKKFF